MLLHVISQSSPDHNTPTFSVAILFNIIISTKPGFNNQPLCSSFPSQVIVRIFFSLKYAKCPSCHPTRLQTAMITVHDYKLLTLRLIMSYIYIYIYIYGAPIHDVSRSHTTTHHSR